MNLLWPIFYTEKYSRMDPTLKLSTFLLSNTNMSISRNQENAATAPRRMRGLRCSVEY